MQSSKIKSWTGAELNLYTVSTAGTPKAIVHITHGMSEHARRYKYFSDHRLYQEYRGDMMNGVPHGNGIMYQGRRVYDEIKNEYGASTIMLPPAMAAASSMLRLALRR